VCDHFWEEVCRLEVRDAVPPIMPVANGYLINVFRDDTFVIAKVQQEMPPLLVSTLPYLSCLVGTAFYMHFNQYHKLVSVYAGRLYDTTICVSSMSH
jgi:hypothetical protein